MRQQVINKVYTVCREIFTAALYNNYSTHKFLPIAAQKTIGDTTYAVTHSIRGNISVAIYTPCKLHENLSKIVADLLTEDFDAIMIQVEELVEEDEQEYEDLCDHYNSLESQFAV